MPTISKTVTVDVDVEVDIDDFLDDVENDDLVAECVRRGLGVDECFVDPSRDDDPTARESIIEQAYLCALRTPMPQEIRDLLYKVHGRAI